MFFIEFLFVLAMSLSLFVFGGQSGSVMGCPKDVAGAQTSNISYVTI